MADLDSVDSQETATNIDDQAQEQEPTQDSPDGIDGNEQSQQSQESVEDIKNARAYYQTKAQQETAEKNKYLEALEKYESEFGPLNQSGQPNEQANNQRNDVQSDEGYDLYTPEGQRAFMQEIARQNQQMMVQTQAQAKYEQAANRAKQTFEEYCKENDVSKEEQEAIVSELIDLQNNPLRAVKYLISSLDGKKRSEFQKQDAAKKAAEAARKAKELANLPNTDGQATPLSADSKTIQQIVQDKFTKAGKRPSDAIFS